jgi:small subunit ribosomal protein S1
MENDNMNNQEQNERNDQNELQEQYMKSFQPVKEGQNVIGTVVEINSEFVFVDIGYKSEGKIQIEEFDHLPKLGDSVEVVVMRREGREGNVVVSKKKADEKIFWKNLRKSFSDNLPIEGKIAKSIKGGYDVDLGFDVHAFMPLSKADVKHVEDVDSLVGKESLFKIERIFSENKTNIVVSRRSWLEEEISKRREDFFTKVKVGEVVTGTVKSFTSFGAFIDIGGFDGLLHINDMSWGHIAKPKDLINKGDTLSLKVIKIDPEEKRINLSLKHMSDDPWNSFEQKYNVGDVMKGKVTKLTNFGAFIELEEGIEGLAHISELSWVKKVRHPKEVVNEGDIVEVKILGFDIQKGKVSLGLKQVMVNPWDDLEKRFPVGLRLKRKIKNLSNFGAFVELEEGIDGLIHIDDFSWTKKYKHPSELLNPGDEIEVMVIDLDKDSRKIKLGIKQLEEDPWDSLTKAFSRGSIIEGEITNITDFGIFVKVQGGVEGLVSQTNIFDPKVETLEDVLAKYKVGDTVKAVVVEIRPLKQRLSLSLKDFNRIIQKQEIEKYLHNDTSEDKVSIGDFIKHKTNNKAD